MPFSYSLRHTSYSTSFFQRLLFNIIKQGPIPKHCAIILDGNRRFARRFLSGCLATGYEVGYNVFLQAVHMLYDCGVSEMTVYMFSQENYKRSSSEVKCILDVLLLGLLESEKEIDFINGLGIRFEVIGAWETIPYPGLPEAYAQLMLKTRENNKFKINLATGYSGRQEIVEIAEAIIGAIEDGHILPSDINEALVQSILTVKGTSPVDLLIRTSGDTRLSDFLLRNTNDHTCLEFMDISWPEFNLSHLIKSILNYQKQYIFSSSKLISTLTTNKRVGDFAALFKERKRLTVQALGTP